MRRKRIAAVPQIKDEDSPPAENGPGSPAHGSGDDDGGRRPRSTGQIAAEVAEAVVRNYRGKDPETALSGLANRLEEKGQGDSELAELVEELRAILKRRLPPGRPVS